MTEKVKNTILKNNLLKKGDRVFVGLSGGADSVTLTNILCELKDELQFTLSAVHVNHMIRGEEAYRDEEFVRNFCKERNIKLFVFHKNIPEEAEKSGESEEECGRRIRYACFEEAAEGGVIATAHTLSDSIETMIFNMIRGSALSGLCGIPVRRDNIVRPLIDCTRKEIEDYCQKQGIEFVTDSTNSESEYSRNYIRNELLPMFGKINPSYFKTLSRLKDIIHEENNYLNEKAELLLNNSLSDEGLRAEILESEDKVLVKRALMKYIRNNCGIYPESRHLTLLCDNLENNFTLQLGDDIFIDLRNGFISVRNKKTPPVSDKVCIPLHKGENYILEKTVEASFLTRKEFFNNYSEMLDNAVDCDKINGDIFIRNRKEGDCIFLKRRKVSKSLKKLFTEMKIPVAERSSILIIGDSEKVLWVEGIGVNGACCVTDSTENILLIKN